MGRGAGGEGGGRELMKYTKTFPFFCHEICIGLRAEVLVFA